MTTKKYIHSQPRNQPFEEIKHENPKIRKQSQWQSQLQ
mgnify:CR=1 FL=1